MSLYHSIGLELGLWCLMPLPTIFQLWRLVLLVEETGVPRKNHWPCTSHWQTLSYNVVSSTLRLTGSNIYIDKNILTSLVTVSEWLLFLMSCEQYCSAILLQVQVTFQWDDDDVCFVIDQPPLLNFCSASSLKQQSAGRHVASLRQIILIPTQPVFALSP